MQTDFVKKWTPVFLGWLSQVYATRHLSPDEFGDLVAYLMGRLDPLLTRMMEETGQKHSFKVQFQGWLADCFSARSQKPSDFGLTVDLQNCRLQHLLSAFVDGKPK